MKIENNELFEIPCFFSHFTKNILQTKIRDNIF